MKKVPSISFSATSFSHFYCSNLSVQFFQQFPFDIWFLLQSCLSYFDYRQLVNANRKSFEEIKYKTVYYNLNLQSSLRFIQNEAFQELVLGRIENKYFQLSLYLSFDICDIKSRYFYYPHIITGLHSVTIHSLQFHNMIDSLKNIYILYLENNHVITHFPLLENIKILTLKKFKYLQNIENLSHLQKLDLISCPLVYDITSLSQVSVLLLEDCPFVQSVESLTDPTELSLIRCFGVKTIDNNKFSQLHKLVIQDCPHILTINNYDHNLDSIRSLTLINCPNLYDLNEMKKIETLVIDNCPSLLLLSCCEEISSIIHHSSLRVSNHYHGQRTVIDKEQKKINPLFPNLQRISIIHSKIPSVRNFQHCTSVKLVSCSNIDDVSCLQFVEKIHLETCLNITNVSTLGRVSTLILINCPNIISLQGLGQKNYQKRIKIADCYQITDFKPLKMIQMIEIVRCSQLVDVSVFEEVEVLLLQSCENILHLERLGERNKNLMVLKLFNCVNISSIRGLYRIPLIEIKNCPNLIDFTTRVTGKAALLVEEGHDKAGDKERVKNNNEDTFSKDTGNPKKKTTGLLNRIRQMNTNDNISSELQEKMGIQSKRTKRLEEFIIYEGFPFIHTIKILHKKV
jgi:hypothetical protein